MLCLGSSLATPPMNHCARPDGRPLSCCPSISHCRPSPAPNHRAGSWAPPIRCFSLTQRRAKTGALPYDGRWAGRRLRDIGTRGRFHCRERGRGKRSQSMDAGGEQGALRPGERAKRDLSLCSIGAPPSLCNFWVWPSHRRCPHPSGKRVATWPRKPSHHCCQDTQFLSPTLFPPASGLFVGLAFLFFPFAHF
jgi:hypothetical protein